MPAACESWAGGRGKGAGKDGRRHLRQPRGIHVDSASGSVGARRPGRLFSLRLRHLPCVAKDGALYVADFTNYCVFRFAADDSRGQVVAGEEGKQLMDVNYLKDSSRL